MELEKQQHKPNKQVNLESQIIKNDSNERPKRIKKVSVVSNLYPSG